MEVQEEPRRKYAEILGHDIYRTIEQNKWGEWVITLDADWLTFPYRAVAIEEERGFGVGLMRSKTYILLEKVLLDQIKEYRNG